MTALPLFGEVRQYAWGSRHFIAELQHRPTPSAGPEAELWLGAHPSAPSRVSAERGETLLDFIARDRDNTLGQAVAARFDGELPFLLKVLAAAAPLSLQAHPSAEQASEGFAAEQARGVPLSAESRSYKDARHKPELIVALTAFTALCGFRPVQRTLRLFHELGVPALAPYVAPLTGRHPELGLRMLFESLMSAPSAEQQALAEATRQHAGARAGSSREFAREFLWAARIGELYPGDVGVVAALMLNLLELEPFQGLYLAAGNLHAYLDGAAVEIMASSDNVLRGGLTKKHVNVRELLHILDFSELEPQILRAEPSGTAERAYRTPAAEFRLSYFDLSAPSTVVTLGGPEILLVTSGASEVEDAGTKLRAERGSAVFIPASTSQYRLSGTGVVFRATVP